MADGQQYDTSQLDEVQHPTLGTLKFPHAMPFEERNQHIDEMLKAKPAKSPTLPKTDINLPGGTDLLKKKAAELGAQPETEFEKQNKSGFFGKAAEVARRATQGAGLPQSTEASDYSLYPGAKHILTHPVDSTELIADAQKQGLQSRADKSVAAWDAAGKEPNFWKKASDYLSSGTYALESGVPFLGPAVGGMADSGEQAIREKDPWEDAGTLAEALGMGATMGLAKKPTEVGGPSFATKAVQAARGTKLSAAEAAKVRPEGAFQPALANTPADVLAHAKQEGINLTPFQASETKLAGKLQVAGEHGIVGGQTLESAMKAERAKFGEAVNKFSERVDPTRLGLSEEAAGESIKQAAETAKDVSHTNASNNYKQIDYLMKEKVEPKSISDAWNKVREDLPLGAEEQILAQSPRSMRAVVEDLLSGKPEGFKPTFEQSIQLRKFFRDLADTEGLPSRTEALYKSMEKTVGKAMDGTARKLGSFKEWDAANQGWKEYTAQYGDKQSPLYKILNQKDPAKITRDLMNRGSAADIETLTKEGMTSALEPLRRQVLQDIARNKFTVGRDGVGGYSDSFLHQLFGPTGKKELYLKADLARRMNWEPNPSGTGGVNLAGEQLSKPSKIAQLFGAAKMSMPRPAGSFLPSTAPPRYNLSPGLVTAAMLHARQAQ
jgi:hypothetical protein